MNNDDKDFLSCQGGPASSPGKRKQREFYRAGIFHFAQMSAFAGALRRAEPIETMPSRRPDSRIASADKSIMLFGVGGRLRRRPGRHAMASNSNSGQKFISRNRKPRVHITYEDPYDAERLVELPFVMGVLADLSGNASQVAKPDMNERKFLDFDMDNFDKRMGAIEPAVSMKVAEQARRRRRGKAVSQPQIQQDGRFLSRSGRSPGASDGQAPASARATDEFASLYGRQGRGRGCLEKASRRSGTDGGDEIEAGSETVR